MSRPQTFAVRPSLFLSTRFTSLLAISASLLAIFPGALRADEAQTIQAGKEIFEREWVHQSVVLPVIDDDANPALVRQRLMNLPGDGLGPMHNATSCESCHTAGGAAGVDRNVTLMTLDPRTELPAANRGNNNAERRKQIREAILDLYPAFLSPTGRLSMDVVVHEKSARPFYQGIRENIGKHIPGGAPDRWYKSEQRTVAAIARQPVLAGRYGELDFYLSQRNSPPLFGLGLVDRIEMSRLRLLASIQNRRSKDGVTGRVGAGKFGWRAQTSTLDRFVRGACAGELGLQISGTPQPADTADSTYVSLGADLGHLEVAQLVSYVAALEEPFQETGAPAARIAVREGKQHFVKSGCNTCHVEHVHPARGIFSDLLLHDMGPRLQAPAPAPLSGTLLTSVPRMSIPTFPPEDPNLPSRRRGFGFSIAGYYGVPSMATPQPYPMARPLNPQFPRGSVPGEIIHPGNPRHITWDALQREWRTPPLWGVADSGPYLHDGRAATLDEAIRWHGGEADQSIAKYQSLEPEERRALIAFLSSLRAPSKPVRDLRDRGTQYVSTQRADRDRLLEFAEAVDPFE